MSSIMIDGLVKVAIIVLAGVAQYLHLAPAGTFVNAFTLVAGYHFGQNIPGPVTKFLTSGKDSTDNGNKQTSVS